MERNISTIGEFAEIMKNEVLGGMPEETRKALNIEVVTVTKINDQELVGLTIKREGAVSAPTLYLNGAYEDYMGGLSSIEELSGALVRQYKECINMMQDVPLTAEADNLDFSFDAIKDKLRVRLVESKKNKKFLADKATLDVGTGLSLICYICVDKEAEGYYTTSVKSEMLEEIGVDNDTLFEQALISASTLDGPVLSRMEDTLFGYGEPENLLGRNSPLKKAEGLFVLKTESEQYGASALYYPGIAALAGYVLDADYYVLPSSLHEVLLVPATASPEVREDDLIKTVREANRSFVTPEEFLSDTVRFYSRSTDSFTVISGKGGNTYAC